MAAAEDVSPEALERAKESFDLCAACHGADGGGNELFGAPEIAGRDAWYVEAQLNKFRSGARGSHIDDVEGLRMRPMSRTLRSDEAVAAMAAYVASLKPVRPAPTLTGGDPTRGAALYAPCTACHGANGAGNPALFGPSLQHASDWYLLRQLKKFKAGVRGTNPKDSTGAMMRAMAMTLPDEQAMLDVVSHIMTFSN